MISPRRPPQIIVLLDIMILLVFALISVPHPETGLRYKLFADDGFLDGFLIVQGDLDRPEDAWVVEQARLRRISVIGLTVPRGGIRCEDGAECLGSLFVGEQQGKALTFYPPPAVMSSLEKLYFQACAGSCDGEILLHTGTGEAVMCGSDEHLWRAVPGGEVKRMPQEC